MHFGKGLGAIRNKKGLTQTGLANELAVSVDEIQQLENLKELNLGDPLLKRIMSHLKIPRAQIIFESLEEADIKPNMRKSFDALKEVLSDLFDVTAA